MATATIHRHPASPTDHVMVSRKVAVCCCRVPLCRCADLCILRPSPPRLRQKSQPSVIRTRARAAEVRPTRPAERAARSQ
eukprot:5428162-Prymnesium_polylepis.1